MIYLTDKELNEIIKGDNMWALMVVPSDFPNNDAGAVRDEAFAQIYRILGYDVRLIGRGTEIYKGTYNGVDFVSVNNSCLRINGKFYRFFIEPNKYKKQIDELIMKYGMPSIIHINHIHERTIRYLLNIAKKNNITIVHDSVEWYSVCEFKWGCFSKEYIWKNRLNRCVIKKPIKVYAISKYLKNHFLSRGIEACRIPVIMDVKNNNVADFGEGKSNKIFFIYAGNPANKDYIGEIIRAFDMLDEREKERVEFNIYGISEQQALKISNINKLSSCINVFGRVQREVVEKALIKSDFSVLLRPEYERYAKAGFPTKAIEAMSHGVAMMCNLSSDLDMYLKHGENAIICNGHTAKSFCEGIKYSLNLSRMEINDIKKNARKTANIFDYRNYIDEVKKIIAENK